MSDAALRVMERARLLGDITAHNAIKAYRERARLTPEMPEELTGYDWDEAFAVSGDNLKSILDENDWRNDDDYYINSSKYNKADIRPAREIPISLVPFDRRDIKKLIAYAEGDNDGPDWVAVMELWDGRFAFLSAGCDYTGWDCQSGGSVTVANRLEELDIPSDEKERMKWL